MSLEDRIREWYAGQALRPVEIDAISRAGGSGWRPTRVSVAMAMVAACAVLIVAAVLGRALDQEINLTEPAGPAPSPMLLADPMPLVDSLPLPDAPVGESAPAVGTPVDPDGELVITSDPTGASVYVDGVLRGHTSIRVSGLDRGVVHSVRLEKAGFRGGGVEVRLGQNRVRKVHLQLLIPLMEPEEVAEVAPGPGEPRLQDPEHPATAASEAGPCTGSGAKLSVMAIGGHSCRVTVGRHGLGDAPFFKKPSPVGKCLVKLVCADGRSYSEVKEIKPGSNEKVIVKGSMWLVGEAPAIKEKKRPPTAP